MKHSAGDFAIDDATEVTTTSQDARGVALALARWLGVDEARVRSSGTTPKPNTIALRLDRSAEARPDAAKEPPRDAGDEAYVLEVSADGIRLSAREAAGLFYGAQALAQAAGARPIEPTRTTARARTLPAMRIEDAPAMLVRAMHLDVARHFFDKASVRRFLDLMAFYRFNVFHWHLSDDQGFRLEIQQHPELTATHRFYTQEDVREIVAYANERFITVVPEFDSPGHTRALLAAHPELSCTGLLLPLPTESGVVFEDVLCAGNEGSYALLEEILGEAFALFPSRLVHLGGDEVPPKRWKECAKCRATNLLPDALHRRFLARLAAFARTHGRRAIVWDDALGDGLPKDVIVAAWQSAARGRLAAAAGHDVIMVPQEATYFDRWQSTAVPSSEPGFGPPVVPWTTVLAFDPRRDVTPSARVLGAEGTLWTENIRSQDEIELMLLPRMAALSDALWCASDARASFTERFRTQRILLDASNVHYFVEPPVGLRARRLFLEEAVVTLAPPEIHPDGEVRFTLDGTDPTESSPLFVTPIVVEETTIASARLFLAGGRASAVTRGTLERTRLQAAVSPMGELRPGVHYEYFEIAVRALPDFSSLVPVAEGTQPSLSLDAAQRPEDFAFVFDAWIRITEDGIYRFVARADDGVAVVIDGVRVVLDDGEHAARDAEGEIALAKGLHAVRVEYFQAKLGKELSLRCEGPGMPLGPCALLVR